MALSKEQILAAADRETVTVSVPEWGGEVLVASVTGAERDELEQHIFDPAKTPKERMRNFRARTAALCIVDAAGNRMFSEADIDALGKKSAKALQRVFNVAQKLNGIAPEDVEELTKN